MSLDPASRNDFGCDQALEGGYHLIAEAGMGQTNPWRICCPAHAERSGPANEWWCRLTPSTCKNSSLARTFRPYATSSHALAPRTFGVVPKSYAGTRQRAPQLSLPAGNCKFPAVAHSSEMELRFLVRMLIWLSKGGGDRAECCGSVRRRNGSGRKGCQRRDHLLGASSPFVRNGSCQSCRARRNAENAHIVFVNHSLLLSDLASRDDVLLLTNR